MTISTGALIDFFGTQDTVTGSTSSVANSAFSVSGDVSTWTNDDDAPVASVVLSCTFSVAPTTGTSVNLYGRLMNVVSTSDQEAPSASFLHTHLGSFPVDDVTSAQIIAIDVTLPNTKTSQEYDFYIENRSGQTMSAGWNLYVTPKTIGPHP